MKFMELMSVESDFVKNLQKKLAPPLVTLLSSEPEVSSSFPRFSGLPFMVWGSVVLLKWRSLDGLLGTLR